MKHVIVVKEVVEIDHQIVVDINDGRLISKIEQEINQRDFDNIDEVADYIDEIVPVYSVDNSYEETSKGFWCNDDYEL